MQTKEKEYGPQRHNFLMDCPTPIKSKEDLKAWLLDFIRVYGNATFGEIINRMGDEGKGDYTYESVDCPNMFFWVGASELLIDAVDDLLGENKICFKPTHWLTCAYDGHVLRLPIAKKPPKRGYKKPHWLPVVIKLK